jgi:hypothetical protein
MKLNLGTVAKTALLSILIGCLSPQIANAIVIGISTPTVVTSLAQSKSDLPTPTAVLGNWAGAAQGVFSRNYCLAYYNNGFAASTLGPASNAVTPTAAQTEVQVTFNTVSGKKYWLYYCTTGQSKTLVSTTAIVGTGSPYTYIDHNANQTQNEQASWGHPIGYLQVTTTNSMLLGGNLVTQVLPVGGSLAPYNTSMDYCFTDSDFSSRRPVPLVDGQTIKFSTSDRNIIDFVPAGTVGSGTTSTKDIVVSGGKACITVIDKIVGGTAYVGPVAGQSYQVYVQDPSVTFQPITANNCPTGASTITSGIITCTLTSSTAITLKLTGQGFLSVTPSGTTPMGTNGTKDFTITSTDGFLTGTVNVKLATTTTLNVLTNSNITTTGVTVNIDPTTHSGTFTATTGTTIGTGSYYVTATGYGMATIPISVSAPTVPNAPTGISAVAGVNSATVSFTAPAANGAPAPSSYTVTASPSGKTCTVLDPATSCTVTGLPTTPGQTFTVVATNSNGSSSASAVAPATGTLSALAPSLPPETPTAVAATLNTNATPYFNVTFTPPSVAGSSPITSYTAQLFIGGNPTAVQVTGSSSPIQVAYPPAPTATGSYTFKVYATNSVGNGPLSSPSSGTSVTDPNVVPGTVAPLAAPTPLSSISATTTATTAQVSFPSVSGATSYTVTAFVNGVATPITVSGSSSPLTLTGLSTGVAYQFAVTATNGTVTSSASMPTTTYTPSLPSVPNAPTAVTVAAGNAVGSVSVGFTAPSNPVGASVTSYTYTATPANGTPIVLTQLVSAGSYNPFQFTGLNASSGPYTFTVAASNSTGTGAASTSSSNIAVPTVPKAPVLTKVISDFRSSTATIQFNYTAPADNGGSPITGYIVNAYPTPSGGKSSANSSSTVETTSVTVTDTTTATYSKNITLSKYVTIGGNAYEYDSFTVTAVSALGNSLESNSLPMAGGQPGGTTVLQLGNQQITVQPAIPSVTGYPDTVTISAYDLDDLSTNGGSASFTARKANEAIPYNQSESTWQKSYVAPSCTVTLPEVECTISGLVNGHHYDFLDRTFTASGGSRFGGWTDSTSFIPFDTTTASPSIISVGSATPSTSTTASVSWTVPSITSLGGVTISNYSVYAYTPSGTVVGPQTASTSPYTFTGLTTGTSYTFAVKANLSNSKSSAMSSPSASYVAAAAPGTPAAPSATYNGSYASLAFTAPTTNGSAITGYTFTATPIGGGSAITQTVGSVSSPYLFSGLSSNTGYTFTMAATNSVGTSATSSASSRTIGITATASSFTVSAGTASVGFNATYTLTSDGSSIDPTVNNPNWVEPTCTTSPTYTPATAAGTYTITCSGGSSGDIYSTPTFVAGTLTVVATVPSAPTNTSATLNAGSATVSFTASANQGASAITSYTATAYVNGVAVSNTASGTSSPLTISGLTPGVTYTFAVTATNGTGTSQASLQTNPQTMPKTTLYVVPNSTTVLNGTGSVSFTKLYETTAFDITTAITPNIGNPNWSTPSCDINPAYSSATAAGSYDISCSGGNGGDLYNLNFDYTGTLGVFQTTSAPAAPTSVSASANSATSATINFTPPTVPSTPTLTGITVTATPIGGGTPISQTVSGSATSATISNLSPGTAYRFGVTASNTAGTSIPGYASLTMGSGGGGGGGVLLPSTPAAPTKVIATPITGSNSNAVSVSFFPASTGGLQTTYRVTAYANGVATGFSNSGTSSPIVVSGLTPGVAYTFVVSATNVYGTSSLSIPSVTVVLDGEAQTTTDGKTTHEIPTQVGPSKMLKVFFNMNTSFVDAKPRAEIKKYVEFIKNHKGPYTIEVVGVVEPTKIQPFPVAQLSKARALSVAKLLKAAGLKGHYKIIGGGLTSFRGPKARYAQIVVTWAA